MIFAFVFTAELTIAQTTGGTGTSTGNTGSSIGATSGIGEPTSGTSLDADAAFSRVDRGDTVGSTGETGSGFSDAGSSSTAGGGGLSSFGGFGGAFGGLGGLQGLFGGIGGQNQNSKPIIRTRLRAAIEVSRPQNSVVQQQVGDRFQRLARPEFRSVKVQVQDGKGVLTGVVSSPRQRRMSELLLRLEPGIREIDNQLVIQPLKK